MFHFNKPSNSSAFDFSFVVPTRAIDTTTKAPPDIQHLPAELWQLIFTWLPSSPGDLSELTPLLLVSRSWKAVAEPVFYDYIIVNSDKQLNSLSNHTLCSRDSQGQTIARWIRTLDIRLPHATRGASLLASPAGRGFEYLVLILCYTANLRSFRCNEYITPGLLTCLLRSAEASLEELQISFSGKFLAVVSVINCFRALTHLKIRFPSDAAVSFTDAVLALPRVRRFFLDWAPEDPALADAGIAQIARSRFHEECNIQLRMPTLWREGAFKLLPLFQAHKSAFISLECPDDAILTLAGPLRATPKLYFHDVVPLQKLFEVGTLPQILSIGTPAHGLVKLYMLLQALSHRQIANEHPTRILVALAAPLRFSWSHSLTDEQKLVVGNMLPLAFALKKKSITLVDQDGDDVGSLIM